MTRTLIILTPGFPKDEADSTCVPARQIFVKVLKETHPQLNIIVLTFQYPYQSSEYRWNGIKVIALGGKNKGKLYRARTWARAWLELKRLNKQYKIIGLLSFWLGECAFIGDKFAKKNNLKHFCWLLGQDAKPDNKYLNRVKPTGDSLIALSDFIVTEFSKNYGITPQHVVPGAVDISLFKKPPDKKDIDVMGAGSLIPLKQYSVFLDVINLIKKDIPQVKAIICGDGPEMEMLKGKIITLGLENNITLMGELPHAEILVLMQRSKVFLHTANYEGFGLVCLEALYAGAKVVSFVKPMHVDIENWHIAEDAYKMQQLITNILTNTNCSYKPVLPYLVSDNANTIVKLYDQQVAAIS